MKALSAAGLADLAGVTEAEVHRLADLGVLVTRDGADPFLESDVQKVRLASACEQAGLPMEGIAAAIRDGRLSFGFLEAAPYRRWAVRSPRTYRQVSRLAGDFTALVDRALMGAYRRQSDRRLCQRQSGPGERARGPDGAAPGCRLRRAGAGAA
jgi:hypothetical protein